MSFRVCVASCKFCLIPGLQGLRFALGDIPGFPDNLNLRFTLYSPGLGVGDLFLFTPKVGNRNFQCTIHSLGISSYTHARGACSNVVTGASTMFCWGSSLAGYTLR
jgi:hypothetical protein